MQIPPELVCQEHKRSLGAGDSGPVEDADSLLCAAGCRVPVVRGIPRFVASSDYASGFGLQWKAFRKTQLDSYTGTTISRDRLSRCLGGPLEILNGKSVLEVGCGAGRFTELMLAAGARVFACDLSEAVEANYDNCAGARHYFVCQADARRLPAAEGAFDVVVCLGVIQHTPNPEETIAALARHVRPGGRLVIDHYSLEYPRNFLQRNLRKLLIRLPARVAKPLALGLARVLLPLHRLTWKNRRGLWRLRAPLLRHSPLLDYHDAYPQLDQRLLSQWSILDTHDSLTDYYKHFRTTEEIEAALRACGMREIEVWYGGNGVEARARMPAAAPVSNN
jgi:SAM-dependent methyltransferase